MSGRPAAPRNRPRRRSRRTRALTAKPSQHPRKNPTGAKPNRAGAVLICSQPAARLAPQPSPWPRPPCGARPSPHDAAVEARTYRGFIGKDEHSHRVPRLVPGAPSAAAGSSRDGGQPRSGPAPSRSRRQTLAAADPRLLRAARASRAGRASAPEATAGPHTVQACPGVRPSLGHDVSLGLRRRRAPVEGMEHLGRGVVARKQRQERDIELAGS